MRNTVAVTQELKLDMPYEEVLPLRPFLRWAGGKRQLLPLLHAAFPKDFNLSRHRFFEPFVGGGAVMLSLAGSSFQGNSRLSDGRVVINDVNAELALTYEVLRTHAVKLVERLRDMALLTDEEDYYRVRAWYPVEEIDRAARFIYLNRLCFNGLYRVNGRGQFNVPYGKLKNPTVCDEPLLKRISDWLHISTIKSGSFTSVISDDDAAVKGDFVYFDPPYIPLSATSSFSRYAVGDFKEVDQRELGEVIDGLTRIGVRVLLSNSDTPLTRDIFGTSLHLYSVSAKRSISAKASSRVNVQEVIGVNYELESASSPEVFEALGALKIN